MPAFPKTTVFHSNKISMVEKMIFNWRISANKCGRNSKIRKRHYFATPNENWWFRQSHQWKKPSEKRLIIRTLKWQDQTVTQTHWLILASPRMAQRDVMCLLMRYKVKHTAPPMKCSSQELNLNQIHPSRQRASSSQIYGEYKGKYPQKWANGKIQNITHSAENGPVFFSPIRWWHGEVGG